MKRKAKLEPQPCPSNFQTVLRQHIACGSLMSKLVSHIRSLWCRVLTRSARRENRLRLVEMVSLGEKRFVAVVEYGNQHILIGGAPAAVSFLSSLNAKSVESANREQFPATAKRRVRRANKNITLSPVETSKIVSLLDPAPATASIRTPRKKQPVSADQSRSNERFA